MLVVDTGDGDGCDDDDADDDEDSMMTMMTTMAGGRSNDADEMTMTWVPILRLSFRKHTSPGWISTLLSALVPGPTPGIRGVACDDGAATYQNLMFGQRGGFGRVCRAWMAWMQDSRRCFSASRTLCLVLWAPNPLASFGSWRHGNRRRLTKRTPEAWHLIFPGQSGFPYGHMGMLRLLSGWFKSSFRFA